MDTTWRCNLSNYTDMSLCLKCTLYMRSHDACHNEFNGNPVQLLVACAIKHLSKNSSGHLGENIQPSGKTPYFATYFGDKIMALVHSHSIPILVIKPWDGNPILWSYINQSQSICFLVAMSSEHGEIFNFLKHCHTLYKVSYQIFSILKK